MNNLSSANHSQPMPLSQHEIRQQRRANRAESGSAGALSWLAGLLLIVLAGIGVLANAALPA